MNITTNILPCSQLDMGSEIDLTSVEALKTSTFKLIELRERPCQHRDIPRKLCAKRKQRYLVRE